MSKELKQCKICGYLWTTIPKGKELCPMCEKAYKKGKEDALKLLKKNFKDNFPAFEVDNGCWRTKNIYDQE